MAQENKNYYYDRNGYNTYGVRGQASGGGGVTSFGGATGDITLGTGLAISGNEVNVTGVPYLTTAPTANNTAGDLKFVVLSAEPATYYTGYYYIITGA